MGNTEFSLILVAGGAGTRMQADKAKAFLTVAGTPIVQLALLAFHGIAGITERVVVLPAADFARLTGAPGTTVEAAALGPGADPVLHGLVAAGATRFVAGGARRQDSVQNGLRAATRDHVLVHDAARPFTERAQIEAVMAATFAAGAAILAAPVKDTLKRAEAGRVADTVDRAGLWAAQTPQGFSRAVLMDAGDRFGGKDVTDCAALASLAGVQVAVVAGNHLNFKITTPEDLRLAEALLARPQGRNMASETLLDVRRPE